MLQSVSVKKRFSETTDDAEDHDRVTSDIKLGLAATSAHRPNSQPVDARCYAAAAKSFNSQNNLSPGTAARQMSQFVEHLCQARHLRSAMAARGTKGPKRMRRPIVRLTLLLAAVGVSAATSAQPLDTPDIDADTPRRVEAPFAFPPLGSPPAPARAPAPVKSQDVPVATPEHAPSGNPLWAIALETLSITRERPIFSSSRRPPLPAVVPVPEVKAPPPPPESPPAERPQLSLVGTIASSDQSFGIFLDQATKSPLRLKVGEDFQGWKLLSILGREAILERDRETTILRLPQPDAEADGPVRVQAGTAVTQGHLDFQPQRGLR
jgi:hypothetical protein